MPAIEDYLHPWRALYRSSPHWFKRSIGWIYAQMPLSLRYGRQLEEAARFLDKSQWWTREEMGRYQWEQLQSLLQHAYLHVPYYRRTWKEAGITPSDIQCFEDMSLLPLLTKEQIRQYKSELIAENYGTRLLAANTGGSTGQPLELYWERGRTRSLERAFMWRQWRWAGFEYGQRSAILRGRAVKGDVQYDPIGNNLFLSGFNLDQKSALRYLAALREFRPVSIQAYPSTITILANYMKRNQEPPIDGLAVILAGSENLYPAQRDLLEEVFQCRVYCFYGHAESVCLSGGCEKSDTFHVYQEYGYTELVDPSGKVLDWVPGATGEIVGTGFNNWAMPLIRYRSGDIAVAGPAACSCGRPYPLWQSIEGRRQEYIVASDGKLVSLTAFIFGQHYSQFERIEQLQIIQHHPGAITVNLTVTPDWTLADERALAAEMHHAVGSDWQIVFEYKDRIERTGRGKHRFVIQKLPLTDVWSGGQGQSQEHSPSR